MARYSIANDDAIKTCATCEEEKPHSAFYATRPGGITPRRNCKDCHYRAVQARKRGVESGEVLRKTTRTPLSRGIDYDRRSRWRSYGATDEELAVLEARFMNGTTCDICAVRLVGPAMCVDHDHERMVIRGVLCSRCNTGLGMFQDNHESIIAAANYLTSRRSHMVY